MLLHDKVIIISGIGPGLGVKLAVEAAREGARAVVIAARTAAKLDDAEARIRALGVGCEVLKLAGSVHDDFGITYVNCGDWVESCTAVVEHDDGRMEILRWAGVGAAASA